MLLAAVVSAVRFGDLEALSVVPTVCVLLVPAHGCRRLPTALRRTDPAACVAKAVPSGRCPTVPQRRRQPKSDVAPFGGSALFRRIDGATAGSGGTVLGSGITTRK